MFYITTAIDYPNSPPHIGTAFEKIGADVQARFQRFVGEHVYFLMGNDENTIRVVHRAKELNEPVQQYVNRMAEQFKQVWKSLDISNDDFIQTSEERHRIGVQKFIQTVYDAGYIYKKPYKGWYCEGCEEYKLEKNLRKNLGKIVCPNHPNSPVIEREEENYFFKLSEFKQLILNLIEANIKVLPQFRLNEVRNFVEAELEDISISRPNEGWGVPIPWDNGQVVYVWFDALLNYLTGIGYGTDSNKFKTWWGDSQTHIIGKDITRFHCALWPAMIAAYNKKAEVPIPYPKEIFAHGFITQKKGSTQVKISKSGDFVDPAELVVKYGSDAYRYYFLAKCSFASDGEYSPEHFNEVYNADLANNLGNLASRVGSMVLKNQDGRVPNFADGDPERDGTEIKKLKFLNESIVLQWIAATKEYNYREALNIVWDILICANKYLEDQKPWNLGNGETTPERVSNFRKRSVILRNVVAMIRVVAIMLKPYLPKASKAIYETYLFPTKWEDLNWNNLFAIAKDNYLGLEEEFSLNPRALIKDEARPIDIDAGAYFRKYPILFPKVHKVV